MKKRDYAEITPELLQLTDLLERNGQIDKELYERYQVNRGLRDLNGNGVLTGLTEISEVDAKTPEGKPKEGELFYRGYPLPDLIRGMISEKRFGFEEITYLLLFGALPDEGELNRSLWDFMRANPRMYLPGEEQMLIPARKVPP